jgi:hypothetical protein
LSEPTEYEDGVVIPAALSDLTADEINAWLQQEITDEGPLDYLEALGPVTELFVQVMVYETDAARDTLRLKYDLHRLSDISTEHQPIDYSGPTVTNAPRTAEPGALVTFTGTKLNQVTSATISGQSSSVVSSSATSLTLRVPTTLAEGSHTVTLNFAGGSIVLQNALAIKTEARGWTKRMADGSVKLYAKNVVGAGKVQFFHNGREVAWVRAIDASDPKLISINGATYLVRSILLTEGKNVFEIHIDGKRAWRAAYTK